MDNEMRKYETIVNIATRMITSFTFVALLVTMIILIINFNMELSNIWNLCFLSPMYLIFFASIIELIVCIWNVGRYSDSKLKGINSRKSGLIFSSSITFITYIATFVMYILMSIVLF